ncbi:hypothetical protein H671_7g18609 [Cricetulus griseus]|nr:hypothetical protein H671_7g18609 [Cricetulus griseus]
MLSQMKFDFDPNGFGKLGMWGWDGGHKPLRLSSMEEVHPSPKFNNKDIRFLQENCSRQHRFRQRVSFPDAVMKCPGKSNFKEKEFILAFSSRALSILVEMSMQRKLESAAHHITSTMGSRSLSHQMLSQMGPDPAVIFEYSGETWNRVFSPPPPSPKLQLESFFSLKLHWTGNGKEKGKAT